MSRLFCLVFFVFFLLHLGEEGGGMVDAAIAPQDKIKNFTRRFVTNFLADDQYYAIAKNAAQGYYQGMSQTEIYNVLYASMMSSLSNTQISQGFQYAFCFLMKGFGTQEAIMAPVNQAAGALGIALKPLFNQTMTKVLSMKAAGRGPNAVLQQVYRIISQFETQSNICKLMAISKNAMPATSWNTFRTCLATAIRYSNCGY